MRTGPTFFTLNMGHSASLSSSGQVSLCSREKATTCSALSSRAPINILSCSRALSFSSVLSCLKVLTKVCSVANTESSDNTSKSILFLFLFSCSLCPCVCFLTGYVLVARLFSFAFFFIFVIRFSAAGLVLNSPLPLSRLIIEMSRLSIFRTQLLELRNAVKNTERKVVDTVLSARWIVPIEPVGVVLEHHSIIFDEGKIVDILPTLEAEKAFVQREHDASTDDFYLHHMLIPGLFNMHTHSAMTLLRGIAEDVPLMTWLNDYIWPAERKWLSAEYCTLGVKLAICEMLRSGITAFSDMYFFGEVTAKVADEMGVRALVASPIISTVGDEPPEIAVNKAVELHEQYKDHPRVSVALGPHAPYTVSDTSFELIAQKLQEHPDLRVHVHLHETEFEVNSAVSSSGERPFDRLKRLGVLGKKTLVAHMTQMTESEIKETAELGMNVIHCPESNMKLSSGVCPVRKLVQAGVNVVIGTDGAGSNDDLDLLGEVRTAVLLDKLHTKETDVPLPSSEFIKIATLNGAKALGLDHITGSLKAGKAADVVALHIKTEPVYHPFSNLAYVGTNSVSDVWVEGRRLVRQSSVLGVDEAALQLEAQAWGEKIRDAL
eukprot:TRINITY_DN421_c0_g1_i1.p1 TRINITY_DN421_c0_g1~~TRINITY_DN421_c0_g1_i1.p1  ORF type:complete len:605 (-),score=269.69 TRINITY_DN421_c0_g1_i1:28-1842(-)